MHATIAHLQEVDVAGDHALGRTQPRHELDPMLGFQLGDVALREPDRDLDRHGHAVVDEHELLQRL